MRRHRRHGLARRLRHWRLIQLLNHDVRLRWVVFAGLGLILAGVLSVVRIWDVAPAGLGQVVRISLVDMAQAWNLSRTARRLDQAGDHARALQCWGAAVGNYPTRPDLRRSYFQTLLQLPPDYRLLSKIRPAAEMLLSLGATNVVDVELAARVYERYRLPQTTVALLERHAAALKPELQLLWARALYDAGAYQRFEALWRTNEALLATDPEVVLRRASIRDLFGAEADAQAARAQLEQAAHAGTNQVTANRLLLASATRRKDATAAQSALNRLIDLKADTTSDHAALWRSLIAADRTAEAGALIQAYPREPVTAHEAGELFDLALTAGQPRFAEDIVDAWLQRRGYSLAMCWRKAAALIQRKASAELRRLARDIRLLPASSTTLQAFSHFVEGQASLCEGFKDRARQEFAVLGQFDYDDPSFGLRMAGFLIETGQAAAALPLLSALEVRLQDTRDYWLAMSQVAGAQTNSVLLLRAAEKLYWLNTNDVVAANDYAYALVMQNASPELALQLTSRLVQRYSNEPVPNLNHAAALLSNARLTEAQQCLQRLDPGKLGGLEANEFNFLSFKAAVLARDRAAAADLLLKVDRARLFPPQVAWLQSAERSFLRITNTPAGRP